MKKRKILIILPALALSLIFGANRALAYFTSYAVAKGAYEVSLEHETTITEKVEGLTKTISITASDESQPVYVRVRAYCGGAYTLTYADGSGGKWYQEDSDDGWWYYSDILEAGETTGNLSVTVNFPADAENEDVVNVIVVWECTPVLYDENNKPNADWKFTLSTGETASNGTSGQNDSTVQELKGTE